MTWTDLRYSVRSFARAPGLTTTLILTIALGIGSNAAVVGFVRGLTTRELSTAEGNQMLSAAIARISTLLTAATGSVFIIACINVATLLLSRSSSRTRDSSVRVALGASRGRMIRQLLADATAISVAGTAVGILLASWTMRVVPSLLFEQDAGQLAFIPDFSATIAAALGCAAI